MSDENALVISDDEMLERARPIKLFEVCWNRKAKGIHQTCRDKGFWGRRERVMEDGTGLDTDEAKQFAINEALMLIVTEIAEACEAVRHGNPPDDKVPQFSGLEAELADAVIRIMDIAAGYDLDVAGAIVAKADYNKGRERLHGKTC